jgi:hypothetical protein
MSLLGMGSATRKRATDAYGVVARIEEKENQIAAGIENQKRAQEAQTLGTAAGIGSMYGLNKSYGAKKLAGEKLTTLNESLLGGESGTFSFGGGGLNYQPAGGELIEGVGGLSDISGGSELITSGLAETTVAAEAGTAALTEAAAAEAAAVTAAETLAAEEAAILAADAMVVEGAAVAGQAGTAMATLGAVAAPIGIALGVGFLLNKIFG